MRPIFALTSRSTALSSMRCGHGTGGACILPGSAKPIAKSATPMRKTIAKVRPQLFDSNVRDGAQRFEHVAERFVQRPVHRVAKHPVEFFQRKRL